MSAHTPGPWQINPAAEAYSKKLEITQPGIDGEHVCSVSVGKKEYTAEQYANARLIAAAPDLLEALIEIDKRLRDCMADPISAAEAYDSFYQEIVSEALAKATGSTP